MQHDLILKDNTDNTTIGVAKIDITNDRQNVNQKQTTVNHISFTPDLDEEKVALQNKVERFILPKNYLMQDLVDQLAAINVQATLDEQVLVETTTTTTASMTTSTTTTL